MAKNVIITGASGNLGKDTVKRFLRDGYSVFASVSPGKDLGYAVNGEIHTTEVDLTDEKDTQHWVEGIFHRNVPVQAALLLVGGYTNGTLENTTGSDLRKMLQLNFETSYYAARSVFMHMKEQPAGGRIVLVGSRPGLHMPQAKGALAYGFSKSLVFRLSEILNEEGAPYNVVSHVIVPGTIDTPANREAMPKADFKSWVRPETLAETIHFLCSAEGAVIREGVIKVYGNS